MPSQGEDTTITLSIGGVEFCLTPSSDAASAEGVMAISKICNGEVLIDLNNFVGTLHVKNYNIEVEAAISPPAVNVNARERVAGKKRAAAAASSEKEKRKRTDHSKDDKMKNAVEEWDRIKGQEGCPSKNAFARERGIKHQTFHKYVADDPAKRRKIDCRIGKASIISKQTSDILAQQIFGEDEESDTHTSGTIVAVLMQLQPELTHTQASNYVSRTWMKKYGGRLKKRRKYKTGQSNNLLGSQSDYASTQFSIPELPTPDPHLDMV